MQQNPPLPCAACDADDEQLDAMSRKKTDFATLLNEKCQVLPVTKEAALDAVTQTWKGGRVETLDGFLQTMKRVDYRFYKGDVCSCTCPDFVNLCFPETCRTCCHLASINGADVERARVLYNMKRMCAIGYAFCMINDEHKVEGGSDIYTLKLNPPPAKAKYDYRGPWWGCSCASWRFGNFASKRKQFKLLGKHPAMRTCTHLAAFLGEAEEIARVEEAYHYISSQGWVPPEERWDAKSWHCTCPAFAKSTFEHPSCKHIKGVQTKTATVLQHNPTTDESNVKEEWTVQGSMKDDGTFNEYTVSSQFSNRPVASSDAEKTPDWSATVVSKRPSVDRADEEAEHGALRKQQRI